MTPGSGVGTAESDRHRQGGAGRPWSGALAYAAAWLPLTAVYVALYLGQNAPLGRAVRGSVLGVLPLAFLGVFVMRAADGLARSGASPARLLARHAVHAVLFVVAATAATNLLTYVDVRITGDGKPYRPSALIIAWQALFNALVYVALAGLTHARAQARRAEAESMRAARAEALRVRADLALLRSQLNPHFVLNVLHSLVGLVRRDPALAERAIEDLGGLLGYGLRMSREEHDRVPLRDEWAFVQAYLELEKLRLGERLDLRAELAPGILDLWVPSFALQPLVENAIVHAIAPRARGGRLEVAARVSGDRLVLSVRDDGPGLSGEDLDGDGLGLRLLRERLAALYPGRGVLSLEPAAGGGLEARLELPIQRAPGAGA